MTQKSKIIISSILIGFLLNLIIKYHLTQFSLTLSANEVIIFLVVFLVSLAAGLILSKYIDDSKRFKNEKYIKSIFRAAPTGIGVVINRVFVDVNDKFCSMMGFSRDELIGMRSDKLYPSKEEFEKVGKEKYQQIQEKGTGTVQTKLKCKDGTIIDVLLSSTPLDINDLEMGVTFTALNITNNKLVFTRLLSSKKLLKNSQHAAKVGSYEWNLQSNSIVWTDELYNIFGLSKSDYTPSQQNFIKMVHPDDRELLSEENMKELISKSKQELQYRIINQKTKETRYVYLWGETIFNPNGEPVHISGTLQDITERKNIEMELEKHRQNLEGIVEERTKELKYEIVKREKAELELKKSLEKEKDLNEMKTRFISTASHEFRTPLSAVYSSAELLERYGREWSETKYGNQLNKIYTSVDHLTELLDNILSVNKEDIEELKFSPTGTDLMELVLAVVGEMEGITKKKFQTLDFEYRLEANQYLLDSRLIKIILRNILSNAIKYSDNGQTISLCLNEINNEIEIQISDNGIGIPIKDQKHLFEQFYRGDNVDGEQGTGLGLYIVKRSVELHNGRIKVESKLGSGTIISIFIPIIK